MVAYCSAQSCILIGGTCIYSLGKVMYFIMYEKMIEINEFQIKSDIDKIINNCICDEKHRFDTNELLTIFVEKFHLKINCDYICNSLRNETSKSEENFHIFRKNTSAKFFGILFKIYLKNMDYLVKDIKKHVDFNATLDDQFKLGMLYYNIHKINKSIKYFELAANQKHPEAQYMLGNIYYDGQYVTRDINKAIEFYTLAANQNNTDALCMLGNIYLNGQYVTRDINKAIEFYTLAADQKSLKAHVELGVIYFSNLYIPRDINKAVYYLSLVYMNDKNNKFPVISYVLGCIYFEYFPCEINKSIYYFQLAAKQNHLDSLYFLGYIFSSIDINKAIYYYSIAAKQNHCHSLHDLGLIYSQNKLVKRDINRAIYYYSIASNLNFYPSQFNLGKIYEDGLYVPRDMNKAIYYYELGAKNNDCKSQNQLGNFYSNGKYIKQNIDLAIYYYELAAKQNLDESQYNLGLIYSNPEKNHFDIKKAIYYYELAAKQNHKNAQYNLGIIYYNGNLVEQDISKAIFYFTLEARQNSKESQYILATIYLDDKYLNVKKAINFLKASSKNGYMKAQFLLGYLYHEGKYIKRNIKESIHLYKEASSFNYQYAKNNLGIIYEYGFKDEITKNIYNAEIYYEESIKFGNDLLSKYNLAHLYFYNDDFENKKEKAIDLLISCSNQNFYPSHELLGLILVKSLDFNLEKIIDFLDNNNEIETDIALIILGIIAETELLNIFSYENNFEFYKNIGFLYNDQYNSIELNDLLKTKESPNIEEYIFKEINDDFYEGFGIDL